MKEQTDINAYASDEKETKSSKLQHENNTGDL